MNPCAGAPGLGDNFNEHASADNTSAPAMPQVQQPPPSAVSKLKKPSKLKNPSILAAAIAAQNGRTSAGRNGDECQHLTNFRKRGEQLKDEMGPRVTIDLKTWKGALMALRLTASETSSVADALRSSIVTELLVEHRTPQEARC
jgi:hypothetical protein